jgi:hypothetical protein
MADQNDSPALWLPGDFGKIKISSETRSNGEYQVTPLDTVFLGAMARQEEYYPYLAIWALIQAFAGRKTHSRSQPGLSRQTPDALGRYAQAYSAPMNPAFAYSGTPSPSRATRGTNCADVARSYRPRNPPNWTGVGTGSLPDVGQHGVPKSPSRSIWNRVMCSSGQVPSSHGNDGQNARRQETFSTIRTAMWGNSDAEKTRAWKALTSRDVRLAIWNILHARAGNPIPGFDNWAACWHIAGQSRRVIIPDLSEPAAREALSQIRSQTRRQRTNSPTPVRFGAAMSSRTREGFGVVPRSNCFLYHSFLRDGDEVWVELETDSRTYDSRRMRVDMSHTERSDADRITTTAASGGIAATTSSGLAPTDGVSAETGSQVPGELGSEEDLFEQLDEWAVDMENTLTNELGYRVR